MHIRGGAGVGACAPPPYVPMVASMRDRMGKPFGPLFHPKIEIGGTSNLHRLLLICIHVLAYIYRFTAGTFKCALRPFGSNHMPSLPEQWRRMVLERRT